jgi:hypothetical protein
MDFNPNFTYIQSSLHSTLFSGLYKKLYILIIAKTAPKHVVAYMTYSGTLQIL